MDEEIKNTYQCKECGLHYKGKESAEKCETWCKEHKTCNVEITNQAEENKLGELEKKCEEYLNNWKRAAADMVNYKKDEMERAGFLAQCARQDLLLKFLPILDNIVLAEKQLPEKLKKGEEGSPQSIEWTRGFLQIQRQVDEFLKKEGIEEIESIGKLFDPNTMEVVDEALGEEKLSSGTVVEELQKGYIMNGKVLRPAKVKVIK